MCVRPGTQARDVPKDVAGTEASVGATRGPLSQAIAPDGVRKAADITTEQKTTGRIAWDSWETFVHMMVMVMVMDDDDDNHGDDDGDGDDDDNGDDDDYDDGDDGDDDSDDDEDDDDDVNDDINPNISEVWMMMMVTRMTTTTTTTTLPIPPGARATPPRGGLEMCAHGGAEQRSCSATRMGHLRFARQA